ncbi:hypothetical protein FRC11_011155, partial [Ceratobasidium sp. 423]
ISLTVYMPAHAVLMIVCVVVRLNSGVVRRESDAALSTIMPAHVALGRTRGESTAATAQCLEAHRIVMVAIQRGKTSTARRYRVGGPYSSRVKPSTKPSLILPTVKSVSARTLDQATVARRQEYQDSLTRTSQPEIELFHPESGWTGAFEDWVGSDEWTDEDDTFVSIVVPVHRKRLLQTWGERLAREKHSWDQLLQDVCDAYLAFNLSGPPAPAAGTSASEFSLHCIHLTERGERMFVSSGPDFPRVVSLARHGYFSPTPSSPSCAIHYMVLRYCAALRRHSSTTSMEAIAATMCEIYNVPYSRHFRTQLSASLDVYLTITRIIDTRLAEALGRNDPDWRIANACSACTYRLDNEPTMKYSMLVTCDGNDSLKRLANASVVDRRTLDQDYFLHSDYVDEFANEVSGKQKGKESTSGGKPTDDTSDIEQVTIPSCYFAMTFAHCFSPRVSNTNAVSSCEERWKNARADSNDKKVVIFDETGVFAVSCRHGFVLFLEDMRRSGELAKYGLAAVNKLCQVFGDNLLIGYDIGCTFGGTADRSAKVGPVVREHNAQFIVGSFHGYAHNRKCQLKCHPLNVVGAGLESFEQNETLFSSTNTVARTTRHVTPFHRRQLIVLHVSGWDFNRRCSLGATLKKRYQKALQVLATLPSELKKINAKNTDDDWFSMFDEERKYFDSLIKPSEESDFKMNYVKCLRTLALREKDFHEAFGIKLAHTLPAHIDAYRNHPAVKNTPKENQYHRPIETQTRKLEAKRTAAAEQLRSIQIEVARIEQDHEISPRWTPESPEWKAAVEREDSEGYHSALRNLESLVVQRLRELEKTHSAGTGYKARQQITKAIYRREKAIHTALDKYNEAARQLKPPRPPIKFSELSNHAYVGDFDFLRFSEHGAQDATWAKPANRQGVQTWQKIQRAKEEIVRLNVEIRRVRTHIRDEEAFLSTQYSLLQSRNPTLAVVLWPRMQLMTQVNRRINKDICSISELKGFTGDLWFGVRAHDTSVSTSEVGAMDKLGDMSLDSFDPAHSDSDSDNDVELSDMAQHKAYEFEEQCHIA